MRRSKMEWTIIGILLLILVLVAAVLVLYIKYGEHQTSIYERRLKAEAEYDARLMSASKILSFGGVGFRVEGVTDEGRIIYHEIIIDRTTSESPQVVDVDELNVKHNAIQLVADSKASNGGNSNQLLTADAWQGLGHRRDDWQAAVNWLSSIGLTQTRAGKGVFTRSGDLDSVILAMAVRSLPHRPTVEKPSTVPSNGNTRTL